ncbi:MAG: hypothetical protein JSV82_04895 [Planctomycetota bacterium]|nr:MAG: hypothetical protein JSV82_04895 [Planctomycetota bacterium]
MSRLWLKIAGVVVLIAAVATAVCIFRHSTQQTEPHAQRDMPKPNRYKRDIQTGKATPASSENDQRPSLYKDEPLAQTYLEGKRLYEATEKLRQPFYPTDSKRARGLPLRPDSLRVKEPAEPGPAPGTGYDLSQEQFRQMYDKVIQRSLEQSKDNLRELGIRQTKGFLPPMPNKLRAKEQGEKTKDRLPADADAIAALSPEQLQQIQERALQHILEEYKDNPEQAEKIKEILLERFKQLQEQHKAAAKEKEASSE